MRTASSSEPPHRGHVSSTRDGYPASWSPCPARQAWLSPASRSSAPCTVGLNNPAGEAAGMPAGGTQAQDGPGPGLPGGGMLGEAGGENSLTADTGHLLVQLTQGDSYIFPQCSPPHPPSCSLSVSLILSRSLLFPFWLACPHALRMCIFLLISK